MTLKEKNKTKQNKTKMTSNNTYSLLMDLAIILL